MDVTRWSTPKSDWLYSLQPNMEKLYTVSKNKTGSWLCSDHELIAKFRLKLKKVGKTTRPFRYDLNKIPNDYTVEVRNRFKGLNLTECLITMGRGSRDCSGDRAQDHLPKKRCKKENDCLRRLYKKLWKEEKPKAKEKRKDILIWMQSSKEYQGEIRKPSSLISATKQREKIEWETLEIPREYFMQRQSQ